MRVCLSLLAALALVGCSGDEHRAGYRSECAHAGGTLLGCDQPPIETAEDACWRLVECGSIPVENPPDEPNCCFDWTRCVGYLESLPSYRQEFSLACIERASCDELRWGGNPDRPPSGGFPPCLEYGDQ